MKQLLRFVLSIGLVLLASLAIAAPPQTINYQGYLTNTGGTPVNGTFGMAFKFYNNPTTGTFLYIESFPSVVVTNGNFNVLLGSSAPIPLPFDVPYWLTVTIGFDPEMSPRQPLASSAYAFRAATADSATTIGGAQITGNIVASANIVLPNSTATVGNILKNGNAFIHNFGNSNTFIGELAGNFTMGGEFNTASGAGALHTNQLGSFNTASGVGALYFNTIGGSNTANGVNALNTNVNGSVNTGIGKDALYSNYYGNRNTAIGGSALFSNYAGSNNTASGADALQKNFDGSNNTANGASALLYNTTGENNTASGFSALNANTTGIYNTAVGMQSLLNNNDGGRNTAVGVSALFQNASGSFNTAVGTDALHLATGSNNIGLGQSAGFNLTSGSGNIYIGHSGAAVDSGVIRIGDASQTSTFIAGISGQTSISGVAVYVNAAGQLGTTTSSRRFKDDITDMDAASSVLMKLRPVTFHYKTDQNPSGRTLQYGLIAEEVNEVYPGLVAHSSDGQIETVMYQHLPSMLLNEFQKQQRTIAAQAMDIQRQTAELTQQRARVELLERELQAIKAMLGGR